MSARKVKVAAGLTALMGLVNLASAVTPSVVERVRLIRDWAPLVIRHAGHTVTALAGFALLRLAVPLARRKHAAWALALAVLGLSAVFHMVKGLDVEEAGLAAALAVFLWTLRPWFHARSDPPSVRQGLLALLAAFAFTLLYGVTGFYLLDRHFSVNFGLWDAVRQTVVMFTQLQDPGLEPVTVFGQWFSDSIYVVSVVTVLFALTLLVRPVLVRHPASPAERERARAIVEAHGRSSLARVTLFDDKSYCFSPGGSVVAYVARGRVALALGDPIGPAEDVAGAITAFRELCARNDWRPAFYQTMPDHLALYRRAGFDALCIGHEAIVDLASFTLSGSANKGLRGAVNRLQKSGARAVLREPPLDDRLVAELRDVSDEWLTSVRGTEKRFSLGWWDDDTIRAGAVTTVVGGDGRIRAFANLMGGYQLAELTVDLMRQRADAENGTMDFLLVELFQWARLRGYDTFNLGLSALAGVGERSGDPAVERALHFIYKHVDQFYSFRGIHEFKEKFHPVWSPRYLVHPGPASLPAVAMTLILADSGARTLRPWSRTRTT